MKSVYFHTRSGKHTLHVRLASSFFQRLRGLMFTRFLAPSTGLLIAGCSSVHCAFMRYAIDVVYLDADGQVIRCVQRLGPWRASIGGSRGIRHTLELPAGTVERLGIAAGDRLGHPLFDSKVEEQVRHVRRNRQGGASLVEFVVVGPLITVIGLGLVQYGMMFFAKNQINHAAFMAARAGAVGNAKIDSIRNAYAVALVPMYGGGTNTQALATSLAAASEDVGEYVRIEMLNPTKESFDDWNDKDLQAKLSDPSKRVIPFANQALRTDTGLKVDTKSGQSLQDAMLLKLRITHGYKPSIPVVSSIFRAYLKWLDPKDDEFHTALVESGRVPLVSNVTIEMQSDAIEGNPVSVPGKGNGGNPVDPGESAGPTGKPPTNCWVGCSTSITPGGGGGSTTGPGGPLSCPGTPVRTELPTDTLFEFGKATLQPEGRANLDKLIDASNGKGYKTVTITGYTDQIGPESVNQQLSVDRAVAVADYLKGHGIIGVNFQVMGRGSENPKVQASSCGSQPLVDCLAPNRRVEVEFK